LDVEIKHFAATEIQRIWKGCTTRYEYIYKLDCILCVQRAARYHINRMRQERHFMNNSSAVNIQALWRGFEVRKTNHTAVTAATKIQSIWRLFWTRHLLKKEFESAVILQTAFRSFVIYNNFRIFTKGILQLQALARGKSVRNQIESCHQSTVTIQRIWRGYQKNVEYMIVLFSAIKIQSTFRMFIIRKGMWHKHNSAIILQKAIRGYVARQKVLYTSNDQIEFFRQKRAAVRIQRLFKTHLYMKKIMNHIGTVQRVIRGHLARVKAFKATTGIKRLQALYRGSSIRSKCSCKVRRAAKKISLANRNAEVRPEMTLGARTAYALLILEKSKRLSYIMKASMILEVSTRLSKKCCFEFAKVNAQDILYDLMRTCNRSLPHIELLQVILSTLLNISEHSYLVPSISSRAAVEVLIDIIQMFRDKDSLFGMATRLLEIICFGNDMLLVSYVN